MSYNHLLFELLSFFGKNISLRLIQCRLKYIGDLSTLIAVH